jgi:hypothetical protein
MPEFSDFSYHLEYPWRMMEESRFTALLSLTTMQAHYGGQKLGNRDNSQSS